ncbi:MAG: HDOD domain-containing protein [Deltaproteobacteria bacterium]|nr:HDOD domain-containing protein [Deltaproteobacteria bacterium]
MVPGVAATEALSRTLARGRVFEDSDRRCVESDPLSLLLLLRSAGEVATNAEHPPSTLQEALFCSTEKALLSTLAAAGGLRHQSLETSAETAVSQHSVATGICARLLATYTSDTDPEAAFAGGVALHFGRLILSIFLPHSYAEVRATASLTDTPLNLLEHAWLGFDGSFFGEQILENFGAHPQLCLATSMQHLEHAFNLPETNHSLITLCQTGSILANQILSGEPPPRRTRGLEAKFPLLSVLGLNSKEFLKILAECRWAMFERHLIGD